MRFLVDENLPGAIAQALAEAGHDVLDIAVSSHRGSADHALWKLAADEARILVTRDRDFPLRGAATRPPGMVLLRPADGMKTADVSRLFEAGIASVGVASLPDHVTVIEPGRVRQRPYSKVPR